MRRALGWTIAFAAATAAALGVPAAASAACATGVAGAIGTTATFTSCAGEQSYTVPPGVTKVRAKVIGAHGGNRFNAGGKGGQVDAIVNVTAGSTLYVLVGGTGEEGRFNGGALGFASDTSGGGASDIRTTSCSSSCPGAVGSGTLASRLVVGGGGGGTGPCGTTGGNGGGQPNGDGNPGGVCTGDSAADAAQGGTQTAGGATGGVEGSGAGNPVGGGGGGGLYGGGVASGTRGGGGGSSFGPAGAAFSTTVSAAQVQITPYFDTTTTVTGPASSTRYGEDVTFTATIGYPGVATGTVQFFDGAGTLGSPQAVGAGNHATLLTSTLTAGSHTIRAVYSGDAGAGASTSANLPHAIAKQATKTATTSGKNPSRFGEAVTFTATVAPSAGSRPIDAGSVQFYLGGTPIGSPQPIDTSTGKASLTASTVPVGSQAVSARWPASANYDPTSAPDATSVTQVVGKMDTTTTVGSTASPSGFGAGVTFTATVVAPIGTLDGGSVQFYDGPDPLGSPVAVDTATGKATLSTSSLRPGSHPITAAYDGTASFATSTSPSLAHSVDKGATDITVAGSLTPSTFGQTVTFTATVVPGVGTLDGGSVQFFDGADPLGSPVAVDTATGKATLSTDALAAGTHAITAKYGGSSTYAASTSTPLAQSVTKVDPPVTPAANAPTLTVAALDGQARSKRAQLLLSKHAITIHVACGPVPCTVSARAEVRIGGRSLGTLTGPGPREVAAGKTVTLALRSSAKLRRQVRAYRLAHPGRQAKMTIKATFKTATDTRSKTLTVRVRVLG